MSVEDIELDQLIGRVRATREQAILVPQKQDARSGGRGDIRALTLTLSDTDLANTGSGRALAATAAGGLYYRYQNSHPGGRLLVDIGGSLLRIRPGTRIQQPINGLTVRLDTQSAALGNAELILFNDPNVDLYERPNADGDPLEVPIGLLAHPADPSLQAYPAETQPTGNQTGRFSIQGVKRVRVVCGIIAANLSTCDVVPWFRPYTSWGNTWIEQGDQRISLPAPFAATSYRGFVLPVAGAGEMFLEFRNVTPAPGDGNVIVSVEAVG